MIKAVLFDLDGTLIDSSEGIIKSVQFALEHFGINEDDSEGLRKFIGPPLHDSFERYYGLSKEQALEAVEVFRSRYNKIGKYECELYPHAKECLEMCREKGYLTGIASSKPEPTCKDILEYHKVLDLFDNVAGSTFDGKIETKEQVLNLLFSRWPQVSRDEMILIGDTMFDVEGANKAGLKSIAVSFGFGSVNDMISEGALAVCDDLITLTDIIESVA